MKNRLVVSLLAILVIVLVVFVFTISSDVLVSPKTFEREITKVETISESNDIDTIEADLNATDLDNLDQELSSIETELD